MKSRSISLGFAAVLLSFRIASAEPQLPGHVLSDKQAKDQSQIVFIGQLTGLDTLKNAKGEYTGSVVQVTRPSNNIRAARTSQNTIKTSAFSDDLSLPMKMTVAPGEEAPRVGKTYMFYAKDNTQRGETGYVAIKLAPTGERGQPKRAF